MSDATQDYPCGHSMFTSECAKCREWARSRGFSGFVAPSHEATAAQRRDAHTQQLIEDARAPASPKQAALEQAFEELDRACEPTPQQVPNVDTAPARPHTTLTGEDHEAFTAFSRAAADLDASNRRLGEAQQNYRAALEKLSAIAAKRAT